LTDHHVEPIVNLATGGAALTAPALPDRSEVPDPGAGYAFDNHGPHAQEQHRCLASAYDAVTTARLARGGRVLATDLKPELIPPRPGLEVLRHDIVHDPLPEAGFDLVHARLVLTHIPEREAVLRRLWSALRPGGWLQLEEFDVEYAPVLLAPDRRAREAYQLFQTAKARALRAAGAEPAWGRSCAEAMRAAGFVEVDPVPQLVPWDAGSPGLQLQLHHTDHLREALLAQGMTADQLDEARAVMRHPGFRAASCVLYSVQGRKPE
jgi:SAM-dependent methyltransferase